ncbi:WXG100 family type VII secretion target [Motilibacter aurantiacus]|uniref:WXG100 family type VII secretion target n=1 Tax=Motilibacter aurantiacus TaxID=2714955 RepID=UPI00140D5722|nr:WXG100 family type VII secretion target [Motilibacter aurantiacus]NHC44035.1 WXG100 family type VII secretion target [Motilibacter aurantiacus]
MSEILVTFSAISQGQADVASTASNLNGQLADLKSYLAPMVSTWTGAAAENYNAKQRQWDEAAAELNSILEQIGRALGAAGDDFQAAENSNASIWA